MNYIKVPDSNIKLTDGSVVMLARFPGTKWVVHYGWYDYSGRRGMGWYFSSIPAQTVIPVTSQDLQLIVLIDEGKSEENELPPSSDGSLVPSPGLPPEGPGPKPPWIAPTPDTGLYPVNPDNKWNPYGDPRAYFSKNDQYLLDASWITLPSIKYRDALPTICNIPDGKIVMVVSVDGVTRYYSWNAPDQRWDEKFFENDAEKLLVNYYDISEVDAKFTEVNSSIEDLEASETQLSTKVDTATSDITTLRDELEDTIAEVQIKLDNEITARTEGLASESQSRIAADEAEATSRIAADQRLDAAITRFDGSLEALQLDIASDFEEETNARVAADNTEIQARTQSVNAEALARQEADNALNTAILSLNSTVADYRAADQTRFAALEAADTSWNDRLAALSSKVTSLEQAVFHITSIVATDSNTILVSSGGTLKDSGVKIGDDQINEAASYASANTLATEKAVARIVEASVTQWSSF